MSIQIKSQNTNFADFKKKNICHHIQEIQSNTSTVVFSNPGFLVYVPLEDLRL